MATGSEERTALTVEAAARRLSIGRTTMYGLIAAGRIRPAYVGRAVRLLTSDVDALIERLRDEAAGAEASR